MDGSTMPRICRLGLPTVLDLAYLAARMRESEREHFLALSGLDHYNPDVAARAFAMQPGPTFVLYGYDERPVMAGGFVPERRGVYEAWLLGTDVAWSDHWRKITRVCRRQMEALFQAGAHRIHVITSPNNTKVVEWYVRGLDMRFEGLLRGYCADGSDMVMYARVR